ncbi:glutamine synthetase family protein [Thalassococcus sp. S3]|uniref:glutamine synthetase family protein n=1 Tax=Thalassococcus sp. S3 TaxID=2017482 RepID=UPI001024801E|nr:glutamine synthetase family protein [Thalassococcus sp. S3]QBF33008.1 glutamine synthetase [Thalassococcus sp. S3]
MSDSVATGALAARGLLCEEASQGADELLARLASSQTETVRVVFPDQHGILRGKTLVASALRSAFTTGLAVPGTLLLKDTSHRTAFDVWSTDAEAATGPLRGASDVLLIPDPATFRPLPWSPRSAWLLCDVVHRDGTPIPFASRTVLARAERALADAGYAALMGLEIEFHIFSITDPNRSHAATTMPGQPPVTQALTHGYQFLTEDRYADAEEILDTLRQHAQGLGLPIRSIEIEMGPSQFEVTFDPAPPMAHADAMVMFRSMVKQVCAARGLHATFMAKPVVSNACASGWHLHQSLRDLRDGSNVFTPKRERKLTQEAGGWIAGLLARAGESCLLTGPTVTSYKRYGAYQLAPNAVHWGWDNRGAMLRALMAPGDPASRIENRVADPSANPHFAFATQLLSGLSGIHAGLTAPEPALAPYDAAAPALPSDLGAAITAFQGSDLYRTSLGDAFVDYLSQLKSAEWRRYLNHLSEWEQAEYFSLF